ncbi:DegQ family serine endoprotease [Uliginosibacterium gangwonense]|uniref:DegQ family serine endoprotease n=1 Tax=Uliginosibacterium gangwonense TaxID=392736 RepID=UPI000372B78A|nr:DegQ family serine endoprotease [Uliginosibacterium gangwonense]
MLRSFPRALLVGGVSLVAFTGCLKEIGINSTHASAPAAQAAAVAPVAAAASAGRMAMPDFATLVEQVGPSVVNISVKSVEHRRASPFANEDDPFFEFFRRFGMPMPNDPRGQGNNNDDTQISQGVGSGFIVSSDGYILTNAHVVDGASEVTVKLTDKREFKAKVVGSDKRSDVALIKINANDLPAVKTGEASKARVGEWVLAVGSPFGFENTVTSGIISAKARRLEGDSYTTFIQTDVAINPGNSGGPLFNLNGEVIGINSQIYSGTGQFAGISFSIPIDVALKVRDQLLKHGKVSRGKLGVMIQGMDAELAQSFGLDKPAGALVSSVDPSGPAAKAGVQSGDIILQVDGKSVDETADLPSMIGERAPGDTVHLKVWRDKSSRELVAKLGEAADDNKPAKLGGGKIAEGGKLGLAVRPLSEAEQRRLGVNGGLLIESASGAAAKAGIRQGDVVLAVNNQRVSSVEQLRKLTEAAGKRVPLLIQRGDNQQYVVVKLD